MSAQGPLVLGLGLRVLGPGLDNLTNSNQSRKQICLCVGFYKVGIGFFTSFVFLVNFHFLWWIILALYNRTS